MSSNIKIYLVGALLLLSPNFLKGQEVADIGNSSKLPKLGDHTFVYTTTTRSPNLNTQFFTVMGYGETEDFNYPLFELDDWVAVGLKGSVVFVDLAAKYQQRIRDWLAVYMQYSFASRLGTEVQTVLGHGFSNISSFEIGWKVGLYTGEKSKLTGTFELQNHNGSFINIAGYIKDVVNDHPKPEIKQNIPVLNGSMGLQYAYGINDLFGVGLYGDITYGETYTRGQNAIRFIAGASFDVNFNDRYQIPIGLALNGSLTSEPDLVYVDGRVAKIFLLKLAYTGARDFTIGLEVGGMFTPMPGIEEEPFVSSVGLASRFYF